MNVPVSDYRDHKFPRCGCRNTVDYYGVKVCECCGLVFTSEEMDKATGSPNEGGNNACECRREP
jgi:hypothetical protein